MRIRHFDWMDSVHQLDAERAGLEIDGEEDILDDRLHAQHHAPPAPAASAGADSTVGVTQADSAAQSAPQLPADEQFEARTHLH